MTTISHDNFVGIYDGVFTDEFCDNLIAHYEWCKTNNRTYGRPESEIYKKDESANLDPLTFGEISFARENAMNFLDEFNDKFWNVCYKDYLSQYSVLSEYTQHSIFTYKIQRTEPTGGYHIWHCEDSTAAFSKRVGVYILYLNDVE